MVEHCPCKAGVSGSKEVKIPTGPISMRLNNFGFGLRTIILMIVVHRQIGIDSKLLGGQLGLNFEEGCGKLHNASGRRTQP